MKRSREVLRVPRQLLVNGTFKLRYCYAFGEDLADKGLVYRIGQRDLSPIEAARHRQRQGGEYART